MNQKTHAEMPHFELVPKLQSTVLHESVLNQLKISPSQMHVATSKRDMSNQRGGGNLQQDERK